MKRLTTWAVALCAMLCGAGCVFNGESIDVSAIAKEMNVSLTDAQAELLKSIVLDGKISDSEAAVLNAAKPGLGSVAQRLLGKPAAGAVDEAAPADELAATGTTIRVDTAGTTVTVTEMTVRRYTIRAAAGQVTLEPVP